MYTKITLGYAGIYESGFLDDYAFEDFAAVEADDVPHLHSFTAGLARDRAAVVNGLTMEHNSGAVEGAVSRVKSIKGSMYG